MTLQNLPPVSIKQGGMRMGVLAVYWASGARLIFVSPSGKNSFNHTYFKYSDKLVGPDLNSEFKSFIGNNFQARSFTIADFPTNLCRFLRRYDVDLQ